MPVKSTARGIAISLLVCAGALGLNGCAGSDGVEFNGKIFEMVGLAGDQAQKREPKTQARAPLVLPPDPSRLPEPGTQPAPLVTGAVAEWPRDRDAAKTQDAATRAAAQKKYCEDGNWKDKAHKKDTEGTQGPEGSCQGSIFSSIGKYLQGD